VYLGTDGTIGGYDQEMLNFGLGGTPLLIGGDEGYNYLPVEGYKNKISTYGYSNTSLMHIVEVIPDGLTWKARHGAFNGISKLLVRAKDGSYVEFSNSDWRVPLSYHALSLNDNRSRVFLSMNTDTITALGYSDLQEALDLVLIKVFYNTNCNILERTINNAPLAIKTDGVCVLDSHSSSLGSVLASSLLNKTPSHYDYDGAGSYITKLGVTNICIDGVNEITTNSSAKPEHVQIPRKNRSIPTGPVVKALPYLVSENYRAKLNFIFKELRYDSNHVFDNVTIVNVGDVFPALKKGDVVEIRGLNNELNGVTLSLLVDYTGGWTVNADSFSNSVILDNGTVFDMLTASTSFKVFYGDNYGDDNKFDIIDNVFSKPDDNNNNVLYGQKAVKLPYFIVD